jgi:Holliday junction resolvase RusA-like endonuclease
MTKIVLLGEPKSTNSIYKSACRGNFPSVYMSHEGRKLKDSYIEQASEQFKKEPYDCDVDVTVNLYHGTHRKSDIDNFNKILFDSLTGIVWVDDSQVVVLTIKKHYDKSNPRIEIQINELI